MKSSNVIRSFALVLAIAAGQFSLQIAHAHAALQQSTPAANAVVASPAQIDLVFNETLLPRASRLELLMKHGSSTMPIENFTTEIVNNGNIESPAAVVMAAEPVDEPEVDYSSYVEPEPPVEMDIDEN